MNRVVIFDTETTGWEDNSELMSFAAIEETDRGWLETLYTFPITKHVPYHPRFSDYVLKENERQQDYTENLKVFLKRHETDFFISFNPDFDFKYLRKKLGTIPYVRKIDLCSVVNYLSFFNKIKPYRRINELAEQLGIDILGITHTNSLQADVRLYKEIYLKLKELI